MHNEEMPSLSQKDLICPTGKAQSTINYTESTLLYHFKLIGQFYSETSAPGGNSILQNRANNANVEL